MQGVVCREGVYNGRETTLRGSGVLPPRSFQPSVLKLLYILYILYTKKRSNIEVI